MDRWLNMWVNKIVKIALTHDPSVVHADETEKDIQAKVHYNIRVRLNRLCGRMNLSKTPET